MSTDTVFYIFLFAASAVSFVTRKLTLPGAMVGALVGLLIYKGAGYAGIAMLTLFFVAGTLATGWGRERKATIGAAEERKGQRTAGQVLANGGVAALLGAMAWYFPVHASLLQIMMAGSLSAAIADTLSSELGTLYGSRFYNVLTFHTDTRGLDGVVSLEGTLIGAAGAAMMAIVYALGFGWSLCAVWIILGGVIGNLADSVLGATLERKGIIGNNLVNSINTITGALLCLALSAII